MNYQRYSCMLPEMFNQSVVGDWDIWPQLFLSCHSRITCLFLEHETAPYIMLKGDKNFFRGLSLNNKNSQIWILK